VSLHIIAAVQVAGEVIDRTKQAKEGMEAITSRDEPDVEVDHGKVFDALNLEDPTQLSPGHNANELSLFQSVLMETFGVAPDEAEPEGPSQQTPGMGM
jgi:hypothetical protein